MSALDTSRLHVPADGAEKISFMGMDLIWTVRSDTTGGGFSQFLQIAPPDSGVPLHVHLQDDESVYLLEGELVCRLGGRHVDLSRG